MKKTPNGLQCRYRTRIVQKKNGFVSDDFGVRSADIQKKKNNRKKVYLYLVARASLLVLDTFATVEMHKWFVFMLFFWCSLSLALETERTRATI